MNPPKWQYNENQKFGTDFMDIREVQEYDEWMQKLRNIKEETEEILGWLGTTKRQTLLEFGTGTGAFATEAAARCKMVFAVDISPVMLNFAKKKADARGIKNIKFHKGGFLTYEHMAGKVDAAVSQLALHHLPDFWKLIALRRIFGMLKDGGKLYLRDTVYSFDTDNYENFFNGLVGEIKTATDEKRAKELETAIREEYETLGWIMEGLLEKAGFSLEKAEYRGGFMATYKCIKKKRTGR